VGPSRGTIETTRIHRVAGRTDARTALVTTYPFRIPHHLSRSRMTVPLQRPSCADLRRDGQGCTLLHLLERQAIAVGRYEGPSPLWLILIMGAAALPLSSCCSLSPQPYHQPASVLRSLGRAETADAVLYAGKEHERHAAGWRTPKWWGMSLLEWTIGYGYGYRYFLSLLWVMGITLLGTIILATTPAGQEFTLAGKVAYSFDLLLPIVELDKRHSLEAIDGWPRYYFYVHELLGFVLGSFIVAGLAGITKKDSQSKTSL
jgi:hypothetical protein